MIAIVHQIFEGDDRMPVLEHRFYGETREDALAVFRAHKKTDSFLRGCEDTGWFGRIKCRSKLRIIEVADPRYVG